MAPTLPRPAVFLFLLAWCALAHPAKGQLCVATEEAKLVAGSPASGDLFGTAASISGDTVVVGAYGADPAGVSGAGAAWVFVRNGGSWVEQAVLSASDGKAHDNLAFSVSIDGETVVAGSYLDDHGAQTDAGSAYVFVRNGSTWTEQAKLVGSDTDLDDQFGNAVCVRGDTALIGAYQNDGGGTVYEFTRSGTTWTQTQKIEPQGPSGAWFGISLTIEGTEALIGESAGTGSVYVFERLSSGWKQRAKLQPAVKLNVRRFGDAVTLSGDTALIGAPFSDASMVSQAGKAYAFQRTASGWVEQALLKASDPGVRDLFGINVQLLGDTALVGALWHDLSGPVSNEGAVYLFARRGADWTEEAQFTAGDTLADDRFGSALARSGDEVVIGAYKDDHPTAADSGSAYVFRLTPGPAASYCTAGLSSSGCSAMLSAAGTASASASSGFTVSAAGAEAAVSGLFYFSSNGPQALPWGTGTSLQCVAPPVFRGALQPGSGTPGTCGGVFSQDLNAHWCATCPRPMHNPGPGAVMQAQLWHRDPGSTANLASGLSDALEFCVGL